MKTIARILIPLLLTSLLACQKPTKQKQGTVYVLKYATHPALDELEQSFRDSLLERFKERRLNFRIVAMNAQGNRQRAKENAEAATSAGASLIVSLSTPSTQAAVNTPSTIPIVFGAVSDPQGAGILGSGRATGIRNVDIGIVRTAVQTLSDLLPHPIKVLGTVYNPSEQNSVYVQSLLTTVCAEMNVELKQRRVTDVTQLSAATEEVAGLVDALYSPNDNTVNLGVATVAAIAAARKKVLVMGEVSAVSKGPPVGIGVNYTDTGKRLADLAAQVLSAPGAALPPIQGAPAAEIWINQPALDAIGIGISDTLRSKSNRVIVR